MPAWLRDGRIPLLLGFLLLCFTPLLMGMIHADYYGILVRALGIPPMLPVFADLRGHLSPLECHHLGLSLYDANPCDPWKRAYNYPRVWLWLHPLGLTQRHTLLLGTGLMFVFALSVGALVGRLRARAALYYAALLASPPVLLAIERGNTDLLMFAMLVGARELLCWSRLPVPWLRRALGYGLLWLTAVLKLYPAFAFALCGRERRRQLWVVAASLALAYGLYLAAIAPDLTRISASTPDPLFFAYRAVVLFIPLANWAEIHIDIDSLERVAQGIGVALLVLIGGLELRRSKRGGEALPEGRNLDAFRMGAAIFLGTFMVGAHFHYRLVFLILTAPALLEWSRGRGAQARWARVGLALLVGQLWLERWAWTTNHVLDEMANWAAFALLGALFFRGLAPLLRPSEDR